MHDTMPLITMSLRKPAVSLSIISGFSLSRSIPKRNNYHTVFILKYKKHGLYHISKRMDHPVTVLLSVKPNQLSRSGKYHKHPDPLLFTPQNACTAHAFCGVKRRG